MSSQCECSGRQNNLPIPRSSRIQSTDALQARIPNSFTGTDSLTNQPLTLSPGNNVVDAVSLLNPHDGPGDTTPSAVCVVIEDVADRNAELFREIDPGNTVPPPIFYFLLNLSFTSFTSPKTGIFTK